MKKQLLLLIMILLPMAVSADAVEINGIYYNLIIQGNHAEVTSNPNKYAGSITIPESVTYNDVIYNVTSIGKNAFYDCHELTSIIIPNSITNIESLAFYGCQCLTSITIPNSVTSIGTAAFQNCSGIISITIPNSVTNIVSYVFSGCSSLTSISIPNSVTSIGAHAFFGCSKLNAITIPNGVKRIGDFAFSGCKSLTQITIPDGVTSINNGTFNECIGLTSISIPNSVTNVGSVAFNGCTGLTSITFPNGVTSIGEYACLWCSNITKICLPQGLKIINKGAFQDCRKLEEVTIPSSVEYVFQEAFSNCRMLGIIIAQPKMPPFLYDNSFSNYGVPVKVPKGCKKAYQTAQGWKNFTNISDAEKYKLISVVDNEEYKSYEIEEGETITPEPAPTKEGYTFSGWNEIPETMPAYDVTVTGSFSINSYKLTYMIDDKVYKETMYEYGATIIPEPQPEGDYDTFEWIDLPQTMPAHDVVVYASYTSGILEVLMASQQNLRIYSPNGKKLNKLQKGLNIVILDDGTVKKVIMK